MLIMRKSTARQHTVEVTIFARLNCDVVILRVLLLVQLSFMCVCVCVLLSTELRYPCRCPCQPVCSTCFTRCTRLQIVYTCSIDVSPMFHDSSTDFPLYPTARHASSANCFAHGYGYECHSPLTSCHVISCH